MFKLSQLIARYRSDSSLNLKLWCVIGFGIIPAIITGNILPFGSLFPDFGIQSTEIIYLPGWACLLVFLLSTAACIVQQRYWLSVLLVPWLVLFYYDADELKLQLPSKWEVNERIQQDLKQVRDNAEVTNIDTIRDHLEQIIFTDTRLLQLDKETLENDLDLLEEKLADTTPAINKKASAIALRLVNLQLQLAQTEAQEKRIRKALRSTNVLAHISFGLFDQRLKKKLRQGLKKVSQRRDRLISQRNALRVEIGGIDQAQVYPAQLHDIEATVKSGLWASQTYQAWLIALLFYSICFLALVLLVWKFSLGSWIFLIPVSASILVLTFYVDAPFFFRLWVVVKFGIVALLIRVVYLLFIENFPLLKQQTREFLMRTLKQTLIYYLPFIVLIILGVITTNHLNQRVDDWLYKLDAMQDSVEALDKNGKYIVTETETSLQPDRNRYSRRTNIDIAIDIYFKRKEDELQLKLTKLSKLSGLTTQKVATETVRFYEETIVEKLPEINADLDPPGCSGFLPWVFQTERCAKNGVLEPLNEEYTETRNEQRDSLRRTTSDYATRAGKDAQKAIAIAREDLGEHMLLLKGTIKKQLGYIYSVIDFIAWVSWLTLIMVIVKSFMYIFARIFFASDAHGERIIQFEPAVQPVQRGSIDEVSDTLMLTAAMGKHFYVNKAYDFANAPPDEVTPQASKAVWSRFKNGVWHLNKIRTAKRDAADDTPYRRIPDDERIVVWTLKPGDAVIFSWKTFVGMNDSIRIRAKYSWQLSSLVFGRMFYVVASVDADAPGDGTLLLVARGSDGIRASTSPSNSPDQLLAWQTTSRFQLRASLSFRNIYRSGIQIRAQECDLAVMHLNDKKQKTGAAAFLKYFLVPV